jgi:hypothetical protein
LHTFAMNSIILWHLKLWCLDLAAALRHRCKWVNKIY